MDVVRNGAAGHEELVDFCIEIADEDGEILSLDGNSTSEDNNAGGHKENDAMEDGNASYDKVLFRRIIDAGDKYNTLDEFWNIVNKSFATEGEAFNFYNKYARDKGFSVRRQNVRRAKRSGELLFRRFLCGREGEREGKWLDKVDLTRRPRALTRCGCPAKLEIRLDRSRGVWYVHDFVDEHNHRLASQDEVPFLWSHRKMKDFQRTEIMAMESVGIRKSVIMDVLQCRYGGYANVGIVRKDVYNFSSRYKRTRIAEGDAMTVLGLMQSRQKEDPEFYFEYQLDNNRRLKNMFWCDGQSHMDYQSFGDVVVFDSTYRINRYKMPFVPFVGMNHHRSTVVFGCGIVSDERVETYVWMLHAFVNAMCQQKPKSIITDGDQAMMKAIREVLPGVNHRICAWHIENNLPKHLKRKSVEEFRPLIYYATSVDTFEKRWNDFVVKRQTAKNKDWLKMMHKKKKLWAASFQIQKLFLGMKSNQRSESLNSSLHRHLDIYMSLLDLVEHYENCVSRLRETEADLDRRASQSLPVPLTAHRDIEVACSHVFTAANFYKIQVELQKIDDFQIFETLVGMDSQMFIVAEKEKKQSFFRVYYWYSSSETKMNCTCRKMEREGLPCRHILHVLDDKKVSEIPRCCILRRHTKDAKGGFPSKRQSNIYGWTKKRSRYSELTVLGAEAFDAASNNQEEFANVKNYLGGIISKKLKSNDGTVCSSSANEHNGAYHFTLGSVVDPDVVANKGAPRKNKNAPANQNIDKDRIKSFQEKRAHRCSICHKEGHNKRRCSSNELEEQSS